ncbi:NADH-quinone oxidoreductase subunit J [Methanohalophilus levihalophilus]|uniref:NADH-quinone oxidoreductase subunit J n=1 Tax=Methanohalophilus levihalophilus TaxID=1431282 RepID=UPI001AE141EF|nr:NADH-quinone oxidoreductase subunit J [Methanohalophilus levihalophilus]MBP2030983.1 NADH-quinone oxidoreductase subunit J [Methanohalophilus levihalophilus]
MIGIGEGLVFAIISVVIIFFSLATVLARDIVRAALALVFAMFTVAGIFVTLNAQFLGVVQVLVYVGAVGVLLLFAVMLTKKTLRGGE